MRNKKEKKDALPITAIELFTTKGMNQTSITDIVEKAGVAKGIGLLVPPAIVLCCIMIQLLWKNLNHFYIKQYVTS